MIIFLMGPLGSGKGTQAKLLAKEFDLEFVSMGDILRSAAKKDKELDNLINKKGKLVSSKKTVEILENYLKEKNLNDNVVLDGFPRTIDQYVEFKKWLSRNKKSIKLTIVLEIGENESVRRISGRRMDPKTGKIYNLVTSPKPGDEIDADSLVQRDDDKEEAIKKRLSWYEESVLPLVEELKKDGVAVKKVDGERSIEEIQKNIVELVKTDA